MATTAYAYALTAASIAALLPRITARVQLSLAKHRSLQGHGRMARALARRLPHYEHDERTFFSSDGAPESVAARRRNALDQLGIEFQQHCPKSIALGKQAETVLSDARFVNLYRVPFQFRSVINEKLRTATIATATEGTQIRDLDDNWSYDLSGSYGVNLFGYDFYRECITAGAERVSELGPVLGPYHPLVIDNAQRLRDISGHDEVSFHMSGTEAVMQAVRLARYHTRRKKLVMFCGAYHGWWDGVQPGIGNQRSQKDIFVLSDMSRATERVLLRRRDIACVLVNPLQALHPNAGAPGDATLLTSARRASFDREAYTAWLTRLREICDERGIVLIFDEVFVGFRLAPGGAQEYFNVRADMVTYGKTLGGGLPVGVVCGPQKLMQRFREDRPSDVCFARGTFNSHPYVMGAMNEFLRRLDDDSIARSYNGLDERWRRRFDDLNARLREAQLPVQVKHLVSICTIVYEIPSRYNWMFQFYLRAEGLTLSWVGSGRLIFSHNFSDADFEQVTKRFVAAATRMKRDQWWWVDEAETDIGKKIKRRLLKEIAGAFLQQLRK